jgi:type 1 glutamine amidotransferase
MREALIVWGGWSGHEPEKGAHVVAEMPEAHAFRVYIEDTTEAFADPAIADMSLIVPIVTMSTIEKEEVENLSAAVRGGVGLARYHVAAELAIPQMRTILERGLLWAAR